MPPCETSRFWSAFNIMGVIRPALRRLIAKAYPTVRKCDSSPAKVVDSGVAELLRKQRFSSEGVFRANEVFLARSGGECCARLSVVPEAVVRGEIRRQGRVVYV